MITSHPCPDFFKLSSLATAPTFLFHPALMVAAAMSLLLMNCEHAKKSVGHGKEVVHAPTFPIPVVAA